MCMLFLPVCDLTHVVDSHPSRAWPSLLGYILFGCSKIIGRRPHLNLRALFLKHTIDMVIHLLSAPKRASWCDCDLQSKSGIANH